jgi:hypothetical protein
MTPSAWHELSTSPLLADSKSSGPGLPFGDDVHSRQLPAA